VAVAGGEVRAVAPAAELADPANPQPRHLSEMRCLWSFAQRRNFTRH
jgi:hypothetical protein